MVGSQGSGFLSMIIVDDTEGLKIEDSSLMSEARSRHVR